ncbi:hypothetical protein [Maribacter sp. 2307ULW6-5]|uniref:hypothetical protein n=1 Tax=Maribacter sp. 2307ULW6-5 TaxID=3386275 RepID=UPI0039BCC2FC
MTLKSHFYNLLVSCALVLLGCRTEPRSVPEAGRSHPLQELPTPAGEQSALPHLVASDAGSTLLLSWVETLEQGQAALKYTELQGEGWQEPRLVVRGKDWFVNWADYPVVAKNGEHYWAHILKKSSAGTYSYDVQMQLKPRGAAQWQNHLPLHTDGTHTEHGFVTALPYQDRFFVTWLDGRHTGGRPEGHHGAMTLRAAQVTPTGGVEDEALLDARTCDCCQTAAAITPQGPVVVYRDRSEDETRDIAIVRRVQGEWTAPKPVHHDGWQLNGCPVNGPEIAGLDHHFVVAWFTGAGGTAKVKLAFSKDAGASFGRPITVAQGAVMGRVDVVLLNTDTAVVSYLVSGEAGATLQVNKVTSRGTVGPPLPLLAMSDSRASGLPQMERWGEHLFFAWTEVSGENKQLRTAKWPLKEW